MNVREVELVLKFKPLTEGSMVQKSALLGDKNIPKSVKLRQDYPNSAKSPLREQETKISG